jgi:hypothetical protein
MYAPGNLQLINDFGLGPRRAKGGSMSRSKRAFEAWM